MCFCFFLVICPLSSSTSLYLPLSSKKQFVSLFAFLLTLCFLIFVGYFFKNREKQPPFRHHSYFLTACRCALLGVNKYE